MSAYLTSTSMPSTPRHREFALTMGLLACTLSLTHWTFAQHQDAKADRKNSEGTTQAAATPPENNHRKENDMQVYYLEIVTNEVDHVCAAYSAATGVTFGQPDAGLGGPRTAPMPDGGMVGISAPLRETEAPIVRPYWLVKDIKSAVAKVQEAGGQLAMEPTEIPAHGIFAIYRQGGIDHGLWQK